MRHSGKSGVHSSSLRELPARRGFSVIYQGKTLLSRIDPVAQGERLAAEMPIKERTLYFCPSPIYGYGLSIFLERLRNECQQKKSAILCVEADEKLFEISRNALGEYLDSSPSPENPRRLALTKAAGTETLCAFVRETWGERHFRRVETIRLTGGWQLSPQLYEDMEAALRREIAVEWGNAMTLIRLGRLYARNLIRNLALLPESENITALDFSSSPLLVLGAGPSLDSLLDELSALSGGNIPGQEERRFKIICVDSCLPCLIEWQILPDLVVILESQHWNLRGFIGLQGRKIDAALDLSSLPSSTRVLGGRRFFFTTPWTGLALFRRLEAEGLLVETFAPLGSVGLSAVALALRCGSGPVLTGGIDFSYCLDAYHARSSPGQIDQARRQNRFRSLINAAATFRQGSFSVLSKTGKQMRSDPAMRNYRELFEQEFSGNERLLDISGTGLPLGVKTVSPAEAFAILNVEAEQTQSRSGGKDRIPAGLIIEFVKREMETLKTLRDMLCGAIPPEPGLLEELLDSADYLWAHFPESAGTGTRLPLTNLSFLKRVRTEIEPFLKLWEMTLGELLE